MAQTLLSISLATILAGQTTAPKASTVRTERERISYCVGLMVAHNFKQNDVDLDVEQVVRGIKDVLYDKKPVVGEDEMKQVLSRFMSEQTLKKRAMMMREPEESLERGTTFLADNKGKPGVVVTASGLQYQVLRPGAGAKPSQSNTVEVNYVGRTLDGRVFDDPYRKGSTMVMRVKETVPGWQEALALMPVGSKWYVWVPSKLGYGSKKVGNVGPNSLLIFDIELLAIKE